MRAGCTKLGYRVRERREWGDMEDGISVFSIHDASFGEDDGDEMAATGG